MSAEEETPKPSSRDESSDSGSESDASSDDGSKIEWLATGRAKRSTAGNRMKTMLANEEPDSDLELLFAEDEDDHGFEDVEADGSDVHMDSSSDDEDEQNAAADDLEGEKQLEKEARERRAAARKRKAQEAIPAKFRKKVRIQPGGPAQAPAPPPRPRKKSERLSWLPSATDAPTRASERSTTRMSKEQLHEQMKEREARRLKQVALMEKRQRQMEARKRPPMTQEERLAEAALVEKRNSKSLNRWEVAEKQREEERRAKIAALNNRTLRGPVITFWSGRGEWEDGREGEGGAYHISIAEKPKKKRLTAVEKEREKEQKAKEKKGDGSTPPPKSDSNPADTAAHPKPEKAPEGSPPEEEAPAQKEPAPESKDQDATPPPPPPADPPASTACSGLSAPSLHQDHPKPENRAPLMAPPSMEPRLVPVEGAKPKPLAALPAIETSTGPQSSVLAAPVLAPPAGLSPTILGGGSYSTPSSPKSNVLAPPNTTQRPSPLSLPPSTPAAASQSAASKPQPLAPKPTKTQDPPHTTDPTKPHDASGTPKPADAQVSAAEANASRTRTAMILQNFDESVIKDKVVQTQILFGRKMSRLQSTPPTHPSPHPLSPSHSLYQRLRYARQKGTTTLTRHRTPAPPPLRDNKPASPLPRPQDGPAVPQRPRVPRDPAARGRGVQVERAAGVLGRRRRGGEGGAG